MWNAECGIDIPHSTFRIPHWFSPHPEQLEPPLVALHDPLAIRRVLWLRERRVSRDDLARRAPGGLEQRQVGCEVRVARSEEHTSELQSLTNLVCRLLLEKKKKRQEVTDQQYIIRLERT